MEYLLYNFLNVLSGVFNVDAVASVIRDWLGNKDVILVDMVLSDVIAYVIYFIVIGYIISFFIRLFIGCFRKFWEVITG